MASDVWDESSAIPHATGAVRAAGTAGHVPRGDGQVGAPAEGPAEPARERVVVVRRCSGRCCPG